MIKCKHCGAEVPQIEGKQAKVFCGDRCRMAFKRATPNKTEVSTPNKPTPNTEHDATPNTCKGCGEEQPDNLVDICYKCIAKGCTRESLGLKPTHRQRWLNECQAVV